MRINCLNQGASRLDRVFFQAGTTLPVFMEKQEGRPDDAGDQAGDDQPSQQGLNRPAGRRAIGAVGLPGGNFFCFYGHRAAGTITKVKGELYQLVIMNYYYVSKPLRTQSSFDRHCEWGLGWPTAQFSD
ncbi:hypothetical protein [Dechloromonas denitrificans]|uniref:hypothetical protein n=1 Tax=Dechloromonas denitrificans TaxID=281362 RepID=UPI0014705F51|nr:hypothetical protein [Dechloromonas denitrificans]